MKLRYKHQRFQKEAAKSVTDIFAGQPRIEATDYLHDKGTQQGVFTEHGFANAPLLIDRSTMTENLRRVQMGHGMKPVEHFEGEEVRLTVEMETGTGKTYTYIMTMYELNKLYGWTKFIIVVPSALSARVSSNHFRRWMTTSPKNTASGCNISSTTPNSCQKSMLSPLTAACTA